MIENNDKDANNVQESSSLLNIYSLQESENERSNDETNKPEGRSEEAKDTSNIDGPLTVSNVASLPKIQNFIYYRHKE